MKTEPPSPAAAAGTELRGTASTARPPSPMTPEVRPSAGAAVWRSLIRPHRPARRPRHCSCRRRCPPPTTEAPAVAMSRSRCPVAAVAAVADDEPAGPPLPPAPPVMLPYVCHAGPATAVTALAARVVNITMAIAPLPPAPPVPRHPLDDVAAVAAVAAGWRSTKYGHAAVAAPPVAAAHSTMLPPLPLRSRRCRKVPAIRHTAAPCRSHDGVAADTADAAVAEKLVGGPGLPPNMSIVPATYHRGRPHRRCGHHSGRGGMRCPPSPPLPKNRPAPSAIPATPA